MSAIVLGGGDALLIVDLQVDFLPGGSLGVPHGDLVIAPIRRLIAMYRARELPIYASRDWHPDLHCSFADQGGPWPPHCVQGTNGAELNEALDVERVDVIVDAGYRPDLEGYSGFEETNLAALLREHDVDRVTVVGLATDYCVKETAADALREGFSVAVDRAGIRGIDVQPGDSERALAELRAAGAELT